MIAARNSLANAGIIDFGVWSVGDTEKLFYLTRNSAPDPASTAGGQILAIYNSSHRLIYEEKATSFAGIEQFAILRQSRPQLLIKSINYGGTGRFFKILDFQGGKVVSLTENDDTLYSGDVLIIPQYQNDSYFSVPYQVLLSQYLTASTADATVLRYIKGRYVSVGNVEQSKVASFMDKHIEEAK
jgi:hypothetical protein